MDFLSVTTSDGLRLHGLLSTAEKERCIVMHVHGYGGDFYSNAFVRQFHSCLPARGITFLSLQLRTTAYITEQYTESGVAYVGSASVDPDEVTRDLDAYVGTLREMAPQAHLVLQGHSFGTNVVRRYAAGTDAIEATVFLSPADSCALLDEWEARPHEGSRVADGDSELDWELFGIAAADMVYPIPILRNNFNRVVSSETFGQWSPGDRAASLRYPALVIRGGGDPLTACGATCSDSYFTNLSPDMTAITIPDAGHGFEGKERELAAYVTGWIRRLYDGTADVSSI